MSNIKFLSRTDYTDAVCKLVKSDSKLNAVVSYWGSDSLNHLGIKKRLKKGQTNLKVICDLGHIACRIEPIQELHESNEQCVKRIKGLHAKVWIAESCVIIGSANSSMSALPVDEETKYFNEEAGIQISDERIVERAQVWFEELWSEKSLYITLEDFDTKKEDHSDENRKKVWAKTRSDLPEKQPQSGETGSKKELRPLGYFVGNRAASKLQTRLTEMNLKRTNNNDFTIKYSEIQNVETFADDLIDALQTLINGADHVIHEHPKDEGSNLDSFLDVSDPKRRILNVRVLGLFNEHKKHGHYLWIDRDESDPEATCSLRLANNQPESKSSISILTLTSGLVKIAGNR